MGHVEMLLLVIAVAVSATSGAKQTALDFHRSLNPPDGRSAVRSNRFEIPTETAHHG
jgi:hypothetical protein